jgi:hypothetical protein
MKQNYVLSILSAGMMAIGLQACADQASATCADEPTDKVHKVKVKKESNGKPSVDQTEVTVCTGQTVEWKSDDTDFDLDFERAPVVGENGEKKYKSDKKKIEIVISKPFLEGGDNSYKYSVVIGTEVLDPVIVIGR